MVWELLTFLLTGEERLNTRGQGVLGGGKLRKIAWAFTPHRMSAACCEATAEAVAAGVENCGCVPASFRRRKLA